VVGLLRSGSAFYAPAASITRMVRAILGDTREVLPSCVHLDGQYGIEDVFMTVPATLGSAGVLAIDELALNYSELASIRASADTIAETLDSLGLRG
jgi:malate dehydrogenase